MSGKRKAAGKFEQSRDILRQNNSSNKTLLIDNLQNLRILAERAGKVKDVAIIDDQIAVLSGKV
ncbi:MAG: hypothetical protein IPL27_26220 [Lewinellaceae bacterium]|nr:hypothetical protein [Lewinellaceae bacterium]